MENPTGSDPPKIEVDPHYPPSFYAALWGTSESTITKWFRDNPDVLKLATPAKNGKRTRVELRIPYSVAMREYRKRTG